MTGATRGIGKAIAVAFGARGAEVVVHGRDKDRADAVVRRIIAGGGSARAIVADLADGGSAVREFGAKVLDTAGSVDILVNNAAALVPGQSMTEVTDAQIEAVLTANIAAPITLAATLVPAMRARGHGVIINMGSNTGSQGMALAGLYGASKAAIHSLTRSWADELAADGVRVNAIAPGPTITEDNAAFQEHLIALTRQQPDRRPGTADEVAQLALFLAGPNAAHIHGAVIPIDGGSTAI